MKKFARSKMPSDEFRIENKAPVPPDKLQENISRCSLTTGYSDGSEKSALDNRKPNLFSRGGDKAVLADFTIMKMIGQGAFGKVFLIKRISKPNQVFAMKSI